MESRVDIWEIHLANPASARSDSHSAFRELARLYPAAKMSLSHTDGLALVAVAEIAVGVDVEHISNAPSSATELTDLVEFTLSERERAEVFRAGAEASRRWLSIWTRKEAALKAMAHGEADPSIIDIPAFASGVQELELGPTYVGAIAVNDRTAKIDARIRTYG